MVRDEAKLRREDLVPFSNNYIERMTALRDEIGSEKYNSEVRGIGTKVRVIGLMLYDAAIMISPIIADTMYGAIEKLVN